MKSKGILIPALLLVCFYCNAQTNQFVVDYTVFAPKLKAQEQPQLIDTRSSEEFAVNHITGAVNIDLSDPGYRQKLQNFSRKQPLFIYSINTGRSSKLAAELERSGYKELYVLRGGIANWIGSGGAYYSASENNITPEAFHKLINSDQQVLIEFGSRYCGSCRRAAQALDSQQTRFQHAGIRVIKIDINDNAGLVSKLGFIRAVPTLALYRKAELIWKKEGTDSLSDALADIITNAAADQ